MYGIFLSYSDNNIVRYNSVSGDDGCIEEEECEGNVIEDNTCEKGGGSGWDLGEDFSWDLFFNILTISIIVAGITAAVAGIIYLLRKKEVFKKEPVKMP